MKKKKLSRKVFLQAAGMALFPIPLLRYLDNNTAKDQGDHCGFTDSATAGPFYLSNTAETVNINYTNLPGIPLYIQGTVYGGKDGRQPVANAKIEIWHADNGGIYYPTGRGDVSDYEPSEIALRGYVITNEKGEYAFQSIKAGLYSGRRRHIHYRITAPGHQELTTQSYWKDEKGDERERVDRTDRNTEDCRYIDFQRTDAGAEAGVFDIYLRTS